MCYATGNAIQSKTKQPRTVDAATTTTITTAAHCVYPVHVDSVHCEMKHFLC